MSTLYCTEVFLVCCRITFERIIKIMIIKIGFFKFLDEEEMTKRWIHAIRRDVGRFFRISRASKVCSLHFKLSNMSKGLGGRMYLKTSAVPSISAWKQTSPRIPLRA